MGINHISGMAEAKVVNFCRTVEASVVKLCTHAVYTTSHHPIFDISYQPFISS